MANEGDKEDAVEPIISAPVGSPSPGSLLKERRQQVGWTEKEVAQSLRLSTNQVIAIETDDLEKLPGMTYVLGYWRSYAQLLKIDIADSIAAYRGNLSTNKNVATVAKVKPRIHGHDEKSRKKVAALFGLLLVGFLAAIWYWQSPNAELIDWRRFGLSTDDGDNQNAVDIVTTENISAGQAVSEGTDEVLAIPIPNFSNGEETVEINTKGYEVLITELPLPASKLVYQAAAVVEAVAAAEAAPEAVPEIIPEVVVVAPIPEVVSNEIVFTVEKESWIDVRDSKGERLIYRTVLAGEDIRLEGEPPYAVFIGSAEGVSITYQNKSVAFELDDSGSYARFNVGEQ